MALMHIEKAQQHAARALAAAPKDARTLDTLGVVLTKLQRHDEALRCFKAAAEREPKAASIRFNLASSLQFVGRLSEAEAAFRKTLALEPGNVRALVAIPQLAKQTPEKNLIPQLKAAFAAAPDATRQLLIGHALAKTCEDLGQDAEAMAWLAAAKRGAKSWQGEAAKRDASLFEAAARTLSARPAAGHAAQAPIFIIGLPRTGTTLTERILTSHPDIHSAGELNDFSMAAKRVAATPTRAVLDAATLDAATAADPAHIGRLYAETTRQHAQSKPRFIDKMPINFFYAALIHRALPDARIIAMRRNPMDACLGNYRHPLAVAPSLYDYAHDLQALARYYAAFDRFMAACRAALPADRFTEVWYEDVVSDTETEARRLLNFIGVGWDARVISFQENAAPIPSGSFAQARAPLYATSVGRWRRLGEAAAPLAAALTQEGVDINQRLPD
ncbi:MAG: sulfotransferase [Hyphomonadaceae bacterium]|nr:sulfotransferase [Hyphomonadaceae bacterium]